MFDKRLSPEGSSFFPKAKRQRAPESPPPPTINWEAFVQIHLPGFYKYSPEKTNQDWKAIYQHYSENMFKTVPNLRIKDICIKLFSAEQLLQLAVVTESQQEPFLQALIDGLGHLTSAHNSQAMALAILVHHRLPNGLANALYERALTQKTTLSPLHWALICRRHFSADLAFGINHVSYTPALHLAVCFNKPSLINYLKYFGADLNLKSLSGATAFHFSTQYGFNEVTHQLLDLGADASLGRNGNIWPSLFVAVVNGQSQAVELFLGAAGLSELACESIPAFYRAVCYGDVATVRHMIQYDEVIRSLNASIIIMPFIWAASKGFKDLIELLLQAQLVDVNSINRDGKTALRAAVQSDHPDTVKLLLQSGAVVNQARNKGLTPLQIAASAGRTKMIKLLMAHGASDGMQVLFYAVKEGKSTVIDAIFESGLYISPGNTPPWLQQELTNRININASIKPNILPNFLYCPNYAVMPTGYSQGGEWLMTLMETDEQRALLEFETQNIKSPEAFGLWFEGAPNDFSYFHLALKLANSRLARRSFKTIIQLSVEEEQSLYEGKIDVLEAVCDRFDFSSLMTWLHALGDAPEMLAWRNSFLQLTSKCLGFSATEEDMQNERPSQQTHNLGFFVPVAVVASSSQSLEIESSPCVKK